MVTFASSAMLPELKRIWRECFGDTDEYIEFYYANRFRAENTLVYLEGGAPVAMLTLLPAELMQGGIYCPIAYVYAVATLPRQQGKGISTKLLDYAKEWLAQNNISTMVLAPAGKKLFGFYAKRGYTTAFKLKIIELEADGEKQSGLACGSILPREYKALRDAFFGGEGYLRWGEEAIAYAIEENAQHGGLAVKITAEGKEYAALGSAVGGVLHIKETTLLGEHLHRALSQLAQQNGCTKIIVALPANSTLGGAVKNMGMSDTPVQNGCGYMNLVLD